MNRKNYRLVFTTIFLLILMSVIYFVGSQSNYDFQKLPIILKLSVQLFLGIFIAIVIFGIVQHTLRDFIKNSWIPYLAISLVRIIALCILVLIEKMNKIIIPIDIVIVTLSFLGLLKLGRIINGYEINFQRIKC